MPRIGLRTFKIHVSEVVRDVQQNQARYTITNRGEPMAVVVPYSSAQETPPMSPEELTAFLDDLTHRVGEARREPWSVAELIDDLR
jgi:prevent-host-death family protein